MKIVLAAISGALTWSFLEYVIHRWLGHTRRFRANVFAIEHLRHHREGDYFAPTWKKVAVAILVFGLMSVPAILLCGRSVGSAYVIGFVSFYGFYEWQHRRNHTHAPTTFYGRGARLHHFTHHFTDARFNHGVSSPLWDLVFGTYRKPGLIRVPERFAMVWLRDSGTDFVRTEFTSDYVIVASASPSSRSSTPVKSSAP